MSEQVVIIKLNEKRYSLRNAAQVLGVTAMTVYNRAKKLGIDTSYGVTAKDVRAISMYKRSRNRNGANELKKELEAIK